MDLQIGIFCLVIASLSALIIYIILSISSIKEDSFEEAKANRRKMIKQYQDQSKTGVDKVKEKKVKKTAKKSKKSEVEEETPNAKEIEAEPADEKESKKPPPKPVEEIKAQVKEPEHKKPTKSEKTKKQIQPPSDAGVPSTSSDPPLVQSKPAKEKHQSSKPGKKKSEEAIKPREEDVDGSSSSSLVVEEPAVTMTEIVTVKQGPKPSRKKRAEISSLTQLSNEKEAVNMNLLVSLVQKAELSRTEIQLLIDALLNKQQEDISEWLKGRQDPQVKLQKQLAEMEQALKDEKQISTGFQAKLKELRNEINADKANARHSEELLLSVQSDCKALSVKLQAAIEENQVLSTKIQQYQKQVADEQITVRKLKEDLAVQQQIAEKQCHEAVINLQAQVNQYAAQSQELQAANNALRGEIALLQENDLRIQEEYREVNANLERALSAATFDANTFRNELTNAQQALAESRGEIENLGGVINKLNLDVVKLQGDKGKAQEQCSALTKENEALKEKVAANLENGFSTNIATYEARLEENDKSLASLINELDAKNKKIDELNTAVTSMKNEYQKTKSSLEKATKEISILKTTEPQQSGQDDSITQLKNILNDKNKELATLKSELESCKVRNNELRNKNWKVVEALAKAEQSLQSKIINEQKTNDTRDVACDVKLKKSIQRIVSHLHPQLAIDDKEGLSIEEWLRKAEEVVTDIDSSSSTSPDLQSQNSQLQSLVQHYKTIITETEGMLNQLQSHVEVEESRWKEKLRTLEEEIELLKQQSDSKSSSDALKIRELGWKRNQLKGAQREKVPPA